ncbi:MAG: hypothetical protein RSC84_03935 [Peptostreptococcaceae bacterium]
MKKNLLIVGAGGHGKVVLDMAKSTKNYSEIAFLDDSKKIGDKVLGHEVIGKIPDMKLFKDNFTDIAIAIGNNEVRVELGKQALSIGYSLPIISHKSSIISRYANIGNGTIIMPNVVVNADAKIGELVILNSSSVIEYDCVVGDGAQISYGVILGSGVIVEDNYTVDMGIVIERNKYVKKIN